MERVRWGILGLGKIAAKFAEGLRFVPGAELWGVASRDGARAKAFAAKHGATRGYGSYTELVADPEVDVIYIATPHVCHAEQSILSLRAGKAVLCEKPFTVNAAQAGAVVAAARAEQRFLMEAMWVRFFPLMGRVRELVKDGAIGELRMLQADFAFRGGWDPEGRLLNPELAGGGLLDVGVYVVSLASMLFGAPEQVLGTAHIGETGVDEQAAWVFRYASGALASGQCGVRISTPHEAILNGTEGRIRIAGSWWNPTKITLLRQGKEPSEESFPRLGNGYNYQAEAVAEALAQGWLEHPVMPWQESLEIMQTLDTLRAQIGLRYPCEP